METTPAPQTLRDLGFYEAADVAGLVGVNPLTLRNWRSVGKGPQFTKVHGNRIVYPMDGVRKWLLMRTVKPNSEPTLISGRSSHHTRS